MKSTLTEIGDATYLIIEHDTGPDAELDKREAYVYELRPSRYVAEVLSLEWTEGVATPTVSSRGASSEVLRAVFRFFGLP